MDEDRISERLLDVANAITGASDERTQDAETIAAAIRELRVRGLVGMFIHTHGGGEIEWQGRVVGEDGEMALVQLYSWLDGRPTVVKAVLKQSLYSPTCTLYSELDEWRREGDRLFKAQTAAEAHRRAQPVRA